MTKETFDNIQIILKDLDENNISSILKTWSEIVTIKKQLNQVEEMLKVKIKNYLKERSWDRLKDNETNISVSITTQKRETFNKAELERILTPAQIAMAVNITTFEKMSIITPEARERLKKIVKGK